MEFIFKHICINRLAIEKLCKITNDISKTMLFTTIFMGAGLYFTMLKVNYLEQTIKYLDSVDLSKEDNKSKGE